MVDINKINQTQLYETQFQKDLFEEVEKIIFHLQNKQAKILANNLENSLTNFKGDIGLKQDYQDLIIKLKFSALPRLVYKDIVFLFKGNLRQALLDLNIPILEQLKLSLIAINPWGRDDIKQELLDALRENKYILFREQGKEDVSVADSLKKYDQTLGAKPVEKMKLTEYLFRQFSKLGSDNQIVAKRLFNIYEYLKLVSTSPDAFKDDFTFVTDDGVVQEIQGNRLVDIRISERKKLTEEELEELKQNVLPNFKTPEDKKAFIEAAGLSKDLEEELILIEEEIKKKQISKPEPLINLDTAVANVIERTKKDFLSEDLKKRFQNIVIAFFKDVRTQIETKIVLKREQKIGGMEFDQKTTDEIIEILTKEKSRIDKESIKKVPLEKQEQIKTLKFESIKENTEKVIQAETKTRPIVLEDEKKEKQEISKLSKEIEKPKVILPPLLKPEPKPVFNPVSPPPEPITKPVLSPLPPSPPKPEPKPVFNPVSPPPEPITKPVLSPLPPSPPKPEPKPVFKPESTFSPIIRPQQVQPTKPLVEEIKVNPRVYGPIEELKTLTLVDWRRWGSAKDAVLKIEDKINLLAEESLVKKSEGIKAWKGSEINNLYLDIGAESIDQGKSVTEIIFQRQQKKVPTLTEEEFNSVVELNQKLRF